MRRLAPLALWSALLLAPATAHAADETNVAEAKSLFSEGLRLFKGGDYEHARVKFAAARGLVKSDDILWNLALAEAKSGHTAEAVNHFREYERDPKARAGDVKEAEGKWLPELVPQVGQVAIDGGAGTGVKVDGSDAGVLPLAGPWAVTPGHHRVEGRSGAEVTSREVDVTAGQTVAVHLLVEPSAAAVPLPQPVTPATTETTPPPPVHDAEPDSRTSPARVGLTVGFGVVAVASLAGGIAFGSASKSKANDAQGIAAGLGANACPAAAACASLKDDYSAENRDHTLSTVFYVGAGAFAAGAVLTWFLWPKSTETRSAVTPMLGPGVAGARWVTTF